MEKHYGIAAFVAGFACGACIAYIAAQLSERADSVQKFVCRINRK